MKKIIFLVSLVILVMPTIAFADGAIFPPPDYWIQETDQKAVIFHDGSTETMILSVTFRGDAENFSWIVPTPTRPDVSKSTDELFTALAALTVPEYDYRVMPMYGGVGRDAMTAESGVAVLETKKVEYYDITVLEADDPEALTKWLKENKYQFPEEGKYLFDDYISNKWFFTAIKLDAKSLSGGVEAQLRRGHAVPLKFTFVSSKIVFPLKISGVAEYFKYPNSEPVPLMMEEGGVGSAGVAVGTNTATSEVAPASDYYYPWQPGVNILLYVFADHKKDLPGFTINYANWVKSKDVEKLAVESSGDYWVQPEARKYYLTKLSRYMQPSEMTYDLYLRDAENNDKVGVSGGNWENILTSVLVFLIMLSIFLVIGVLSPVGLIFIVCTLLQIFVKHKAVKIVAWILQGLTLLITVSLGALLFLGWSAYGVGYWMGMSYDSSMVAAITAVWLIFTAAMVGIMVWQILRLRKNKKS
ncbi:MAG: DUF2330 domain-containing protein [Patescibacteria group bacterium]